jgi:hypothetical protein
MFFTSALMGKSFRSHIFLQTAPIQNGLSLSLSPAAIRSLAYTAHPHCSFALSERFENVPLGRVT